jgi:hypothetical protein
MFIVLYKDDFGQDRLSKTRQAEGISFTEQGGGGVLLTHSADGSTLTLSVAPLLPPSVAKSNITHFCLDGVRTAAHDVAVVYDATGSHYGR